jgi:hypothetical protein
MVTKFKIVETSDYILAVSGNPDGLYNTSIQELINKGWVKAHQPKGNAPELDLPLLPKFLNKEDIEDIAEISSEKHHYAFGQQSEFYQLGFIEGYKSATKVYDEEDLRGAFISGKHGGKTETYMEFEEFIQSLKQSKTPKWFVVEMGKFVNCKDHMVCLRGCKISDNTCRHPVIDHSQMKTKTNSEGKKVLVGKYE